MYDQGYDDALCKLGLDKTAGKVQDTAKQTWRGAKEWFNTGKGKAKDAYKWGKGKGKDAYSYSKDKGDDALDWTKNQLKEHPYRSAGIAAGAGGVAGAGLGTGITYAATRKGKSKEKTEEKTAVDSSWLQAAWTEDIYSE